MKLSHTIDKPILDRYGGVLGELILLSIIFSPVMSFFEKYPILFFTVYTFIAIAIIAVLLRMFYIQYKYKKEVSLMALVLCLVVIGYYTFSLPENISELLF